MKRNEYKYPRILATLIGAGVGRRKARRMIKHAEFVGHKTQNSAFRDDSASIAGFCIWCDQGKYASAWMEAAYA
ncbi:MAG: hypothetical protein ACRC29_02330 [Enterobacterales bacterium]